MTKALDVIELRHVQTEAERDAAYPVMRQLRPHLTDAASFGAQVLRQQGDGYRLLAAWEGPRVLGLAGYRQQENLIYGRFVYVDDLVVDETGRRHGLGARLLEETRTIARAQQCAWFVLDTGLHMALAQRFYFRQGLLARGMRFSEALS